MAGVQISTLIECWRTDGRTMAGAMGVACEEVSWARAVAVIDVSKMYCAAASNMCV
jgi:hypothetical protein